jgi:hypothetical protein
MRRNPFNLILLICILTLALAACAKEETSAVQAVESYLQALVDQDYDRLINRSCADWEASARIELDSLVNVSTQLEGLQCQEASQEVDDTLVTCSGKIVFDYDGEIQELDLAGRNYAVREERGEWRVCGYR